MTCRALRDHYFHHTQAVPSCRRIVPMERRLAAILAADVVGYSRLMEADEVGVLGALKG
jgi:class 3 adenylate cyclase